MVIPTVDVYLSLEGVIMDKLQDARIQINEIDKEMAALFERRMQAAKSIAEYKKEHGLQIYDAGREQAVIEKNSAYINAEYQRLMRERESSYSSSRSETPTDAYGRPTGKPF